MPTTLKWNNWEGQSCAQSRSRKAADIRIWASEFGSESMGSNDDTMPVDVKGLAYSSYALTSPPLASAGFLRSPSGSIHWVFIRHKVKQRSRCGSSSEDKSKKAESAKAHVGLLSSSLRNPVLAAVADTKAHVPPIQGFNGHSPAHDPNSSQERLRHFISLECAWLPQR